MWLYLAHEGWTPLSRGINCVYSHHIEAYVLRQRLGRWIKCVSGVFFRPKLNCVSAETDKPTGRNGDRFPPKEVCEEASHRCIVVRSHRGLVLFCVIGNRPDCAAIVAQSECVSEVCGEFLGVGFVNLECA